MFRLRSIIIACVLENEGTFFYITVNYYSVLIFVKIVHKREENDVNLKRQKETKENPDAFKTNHVIEQTETARYNALRQFSTFIE